LKQYPDHKISVEGYTDSTGGDAFNQQLSEGRAASVRSVLVAGGLDSSVITVHGYGKAFPVATNATTDGRQQNRRVEIVVLGAGKLGDPIDSRGAGGGASVAPNTNGDGTVVRPPARDSGAAPGRAVSTPTGDSGRGSPSDSARHP
jgi:hypothetical protein